DEPEYVAVIVAPDVSCDPLTGNVAVAVPADPTRATDPSTAEPAENWTSPLGVTPFTPVTVAIRKTASLDATELSLVTKLTETSEAGGVTLAPVHALTNLATSTDPSPVT